MVIAAPQQGDQIVAKWPGQRALEVDDPEPLLMDHQVHGVEIAMHGDGGEPGDVGEQVALDRGPLRWRLDAEPTGQAPVGEAVHLLFEKVGGVAWQRGGRRESFDLVEQRQRLRSSLACARLGVEVMVETVVAEIVELDESRVEVDGVQAGYRQAGLAPLAADGHERLAILQRRRRVHDDPCRAVREGDATVATQAGVAGHRFQSAGFR